MTEERNQASKHQDKQNPQEPIHIAIDPHTQQGSDQNEFHSNMSSGERNKRAKGLDLNAPEFTE